MTVVIRIVIWSLAISLLPALPSVATAGVRSVTTADPVDAQPSLSGAPTRPEVVRAQATYDDSGIITVEAWFNGPLSALDSVDTDAFRWTFDADFDYFDPDLRTCGTGRNGAASTSGEVRSYVGEHSSYLTVAGFQGSLDMERTEAPDARSLRFTARSPALANRDYDCVRMVQWGRTSTSPETRGAQYAEECGCWAVWFVDDAVGIRDRDGDVFEGKALWFPGHEPKKPRTSMSWKPRVSGRVLRLWDWEVQPDVIGLNMPPWRGKLRFEIQKGRRLIVRQGKLSQMRQGQPGQKVTLTRGRWRVTYRYGGDAWRRASIKHTKYVTIR